MNRALKWLHDKDNDGKIVKTYTRREEIKEQLINYNKKHYAKVFETPIYQDKIYEKLQENTIRDQILNGTLTR